MTGYEIRNAMKRAYGIDIVERMFETDDRKQEDTGAVLVRMLTIIAVAMRGGV